MGTLKKSIRIKASRPLVYYILHVFISCQISISKLHQHKRYIVLFMNVCTLNLLPSLVTCVTSENSWNMPGVSWMMSLCFPHERSLEEYSSFNLGPTATTTSANLHKSTSVVFFSSALEMASG